MSTFPDNDSREHFQAQAEFISALSLARASAGVREHGGKLWRKNVLNEVWEEWTDLGQYIYTLHCVQLPRVIALLENALDNSVDGAWPEMSRDVQRALNILRVGNAEGRAEEERQKKRWTATTANMEEIQYG